MPPDLTALRGKTVALDFDGVLHSYVSGWTGVEPTDPPTPGALDFVRELLAAGVVVRILTTRAQTPEGQTATVRWLIQHGFRDHQNTEDLLVTCEKIPAVAYVDDRAVRGSRGALRPLPP
jgi:hypothetical protein